jgi:hypothetical protein
MCVPHGCAAAPSHGESMSGAKLRLGPRHNTTRHDTIWHRARWAVVFSLGPVNGAVIGTRLLLAVTRIITKRLLVFVVPRSSATSTSLVVTLSFATSSFQRRKCLLRVAFLGTTQNTSFCNSASRLPVLGVFSTILLWLVCSCTLLQIDDIYVVTNLLLFFTINYA